jgi:hypothetical protein
MFEGESRAAFRRTVEQDAGTWARARGWALWKSLIVMAAALDNDEARVATNRRVIEEVLADHAAVR